MATPERTVRISTSLGHKSLYRTDLKSDVGGREGEARAEELAVEICSDTT